MKVLFVAGFGPIVRDLQESARFYRDGLGLPLPEGDYVATDDLPGVKHFGLWTLADAAESCFGSREWPQDIPAPQGGIEFDVDDVAAGAEELRAKGYRLLVGPKEEPWGQTVARLLSPEGLLVGITLTPWMRENKKESGG
jgi:catechol 2,3-dioxygenase-like lactoylglutathione lyase family enzyme